VVQLIEVPKHLMAEFDVDPALGQFDNVVKDQLARLIIESLQATKEKQ
jgi:hypothetical protein